RKCADATAQASFRFSANGKLRGIVKGDQVIFEIVETGETRSLPRAQFMSSVLAFARDGKSLAVGALRKGASGTWDEQASRVTVLDPAGVRSPTVLRDAAGIAEFSPDDHYLVTAGPKRLTLWELASGHEVLHREPPDPFLAAFANAFC